MHALRLVPSQVPAQTVPSLLHAGLPAAGGPVTAVHVPTLPATLHDSHWPLQSVSQQTPSTQLPLLHSTPRAHPEPLSPVGVQTPDVAQNLPAPHCVSVLQPEHLLFEHTFWPQSIGALAGGQLPCPSQNVAGVAWLFVQVGARHWVDALGTEHCCLLMPSQVPLHDEPSPGQAARGVTGVPVTAEHVPTLPFRLQASH